MRLVSFEQDKQAKIGVLKDDQIIEIAGAANMIALLEMGADGMALAQAAIDGAPADAGIALADVALQSPVVRPGKVIALGRNYAAHAAEGGAKPPDFPMLFHKTHTSLTGSGQPVVIPEGTKKVDYEAELSIIIGKTCKNVSEADALDYVAGYTVANDISARDWQRQTSQFSAGKMVDGFGPHGPALVTKDEVADVQNLDIRLWHNGNLMQSSNTRMMIFSVAFTIAFVSRITTLEVGDIIMTGTPEGVGYARTPPVFMQPGDEVTVEVEGLGKLTNHFIAP